MRSMANVHLARPPAEATPGAGCRQAGAGALDDQFALEFGQGCEDAEDQAAVGGAGVDLGAGASQHVQADTPRARSSSTVFTRCFRSRPRRVEPPDDEGVARLQRLQAGLQARAVIQASRGAVFVEALLGNAGRRAGRRAAGRGAGCRPPLRLVHSQSACCPYSLNRIDDEHHAILPRIMQRVVLW